MGDVERLNSLYEGGQFDQAWALYRQLEATGEASPEAHLVGARTARRMGDLYGARGAIDRAVDGTPGGEIRGQVLFCAGVVYRELGDVHMAIDQFRTFLADGADHPQAVEIAAGHAWYNLGLALRQARQLDASLDAYRMACDLHRVNNLRQSLREALQNLAWVACMLGQPETARVALDEAEGLLENEKAHWHQRVGVAYLASFAVDQSEALRRCEEIVSYCGEVPAGVRSHACWVAGAVALRLGRLDEAEALAEQAVHYGSLDRSDSRALRDAAELLREVRSAQLQTGA